MTDDQIRQAYIDYVKDKTEFPDRSEVFAAGYKAALASLEQVGDFLHHDYGGWQQLRGDWKEMRDTDDLSTQPTPLYRIKDKS